MSKFYPWNQDTRPGAAYFEDREERTRELMKRQKRRSWRDDARDKGIFAYSFDDYMEKLAAQRDDDRMAQIMHEAERKFTDAQLCGVPEPEKHACANCGRIGDDSEVIEAKCACGTGYGEWYCMRGQGCQEHK